MQLVDSCQIQIANFWDLSEPLKPSGTCRSSHGLIKGASAFEKTPSVIDMSAAALQPCRLRDDPISHCLSTPRLCPRAVSSVNQSRTIQYSAQKSAIVPVRRTEYAKVQHADRLRSNLAASSSGIPQYAKGLVAAGELRSKRPQINLLHWHAGTSDAPQANTAYLGLLFGGWYAFNIYFNT